MMGSGSRRAPAVLGAALAVLALAAAAPARAEDDERGRELFTFCQQCHGEEAGGNPLALAPSIAGLPAYYVKRQLSNFHAGVRGTHFDDYSGMRMRAMSLWLGTDANIEAVTAYIAALPPVKPAPIVQGGNAAAGAALYATCAACHGPEGKGNEAMGSPPLDHQSDWYLLTQLQHFKAGIRGSNSKDTQGALMRPMANLLPNEQAMKDVVAYIMSFRIQTAQK
jgi:cytochrome c oxidase subunit 2